MGINNKKELANFLRTLSNDLFETHCDSKLYEPSVDDLCEEDVYKLASFLIHDADTKTMSSLSNDLIGKHLGILYKSPFDENKVNFADEILNKVVNEFKPRMQAMLEKDYECLLLEKEAEQKYNFCGFDSEDSEHKHFDDIDRIQSCRMWG